MVSNFIIDTEPFDSRSVANFILDACDTLHRPITHLALQKIIYFCHGWHLAKYSRPLVVDCPEAWAHGPVFRPVFDQFKDCRRQTINKRALIFDFISGEHLLAKMPIQSDLETFLMQIVRYYIQFSAITLREMSHEQGGPWRTVWDLGKSGSKVGMKIPNSLIQSHFLSHPLESKVVH